MSSRIILIIAASFVVATVQAADPFSRFFLPQAKYTWNGTPVVDSEVFIPTVSDDGSFTIPVTAPKDGKLPWTFGGAFSAEPIELGKAKGLSFTGPDAKTMALVSPNNGVGVATSFYFPLTSKMRSLTFQIAGTNSFSGAYAELLIDGKQMFRQAPDSTAKGTNVAWELGKYNDPDIKKLAMLRIVDRDDRGMIAIANGPARLFPTLSINTDSLADDISLRKAGLRSIVSDKVSFFRPRSPEEKFSQKYRSEAEFILPANNLTYNDFCRTRDLVCTAVYKNIDFRTGESLAELSTRISALVRDLTGSAVDPSFKEWLLAEAVCAFVVSSFDYDSEVARLNPGLTNSYRSGQALLDMRIPKSICSGLALLTRDIARASGLKCRYVGGFARSVGGTLGETSNHAWVVFQFSSGLEVPADPTSGVAGESQRLRYRSARSKPFAEHILPTLKSEWELFLSLRYAKDEASIRYGDMQSVWNPAGIEFEDFVKLDTNRLLTLSQLFERRSARARP
jgi:transglutaminase-like putative cysteine protease